MIASTYANTVVSNLQTQLSSYITLILVIVVPFPSHRAQSSTYGALCTRCGLRRHYRRGGGGGYESDREQSATA